MAFCSGCGRELEQGVKFCSECGEPINKSNQTYERRKTIYDGEIHKCPNCGEKLQSFITNCPSCGYELRNVLNSNAVQVFANRLAESETQQERIAIIRNFPIPNTKEDILEFMILASTNVDDNLEKEISAAWNSKTEQAYQKAQILFKDEKDFSRIQSIYSQVCTKLAIQKKNEKVKNVGSVLGELIPVLPNMLVVTGWLISIFVLIPLCKINLDNVGTNGSQLLLMFDFIAGAIFVPFAFRCSSLLPKLITSLGLVLSVIVLIPLCGKNLDNVDTNAFQIILVVDIICSIIILVRMFKQKHMFEMQKSTLNRISFILVLICLAIMLIVYVIGNITTDIIATKDNISKEQEKLQAQSITYEWPSRGLSVYLPIPLSEYGKIKTDNETRFNIEIYQISLEDFENYVKYCKEKGFTTNTTKTDSVFYAYHDPEQYSLSIFYWNENETMDIFLDAPEKMSNFEWPTSKIAQKLPLPKSFIGRVWSDTSEDFGVNIANISQEDFSAYVDECMKNGFTVDYARENDFFNACNKSGDELTLRLQVFDVMQIYIETPENE